MMEELLAYITSLLVKAGTAVLTSLGHNWIPLGLAVITAAVLKAQVDTGKIKQAMLGKTKASIWASVAIGAFTPFCACGTMAVVIGMLTTTLPWGPVMAFLTSSPLMSPDGFILLAGVVGLKFAIALTIASVVIGLGSGYLTHLIEIRTGFLKDQTRFAEKAPQAPACGCAAAVSEQAVLACGVCGASADGMEQTACASACGQATSEHINADAAAGVWAKIRWQEIAEGLLNLGLKQILPNFALFVAIGFLVNYFVPTKLIMALFSAKNIFAVPLAAFIGLPLYVTTESSIPLINSLMAAGASGGAMLAFMITGAATSAWVIAGIATFMKKRVIGLYVLFILIGGILSGYLYDLFLVIAK